MTLKTIQRGATRNKMVAAHNKEFGTKLTVDQVAKANGRKTRTSSVPGSSSSSPTSSRPTRRKA